MARINTVSVIEMADDNLIGQTSYEENDAGNKEVEEHFRKCAIENGALDEEVDSFIEDGYYEQGTYQLFLTHSL